MLLSELLEPRLEPCPLTSRIDALGGMEPSPELGSGGLDERLGQNGFAKAPKNHRLDRIGRHPARPTAAGRTAVIAALGAALEMGFPAHPGATRALE